MQILINTFYLLSLLLVLFTYYLILIRMFLPMLVFKVILNNIHIFLLNFIRQIELNSTNRTLSKSEMKLKISLHIVIILFTVFF